MEEGITEDMKVKIKSLYVDYVKFKFLRYIFQNSRGFLFRVYISKFEVIWR